MFRSLTSVALLMSAMSGQISAENRLEVVVSIPPQQWLVEQIGADKVEVAVLVAPGESPTTYQPSDAEVTHLMRSRIFFRVGVPFERGLWFDAVSQMGRFEMVDLRRGIELVGEDPHTWLNPRLLSIQADTVADALSQADPNHRSLYTANLHRLKIRLGILDEEIRQALQPYSGEEFFVFHPSWGYFAREYGLHQVAIEAEGREPSDRELTGLQELAVDKRVTTVFVQPQIHGRSAAAFAESTGARLELLDPLVADVAANLADATAKLIEALGRAEER